MKVLFSAIISGFLFGLGLSVSGMTDTSNVIAFLNISPEWQINLAVVMGTALLVTIPGFAILKCQQKPAFTEQFDAPKNNNIDTKLLLGSGLFGIGWGMVGYCPGPAVGSLYYGHESSMIFVAVMVVSGLLTKVVLSYSKPSSAKLTTSFPPITK